MSMILQSRFPTGFVSLLFLVHFISFYQPLETVSLTLLFVFTICCIFFFISFSFYFFLIIIVPTASLRYCFSFFLSFFGFLLFLFVILLFSFPTIYFYELTLFPLIFSSCSSESTLVLVSFFSSCFIYSYPSSLPPPPSPLS